MRRKRQLHLLPVEGCRFRDNDDIDVIQRIYIVGITGYQSIGIETVDAIFKKKEPCMLYKEYPLDIIDGV